MPQNGLTKGLDPEKKEQKECKGEGNWRKASAETGEETASAILAAITFRVEGDKSLMEKAFDY